MNSSKKSFFSNLKNDLPASLVVFLVAVPLCLGIALASGAPLFSGIIAGIVGGIVVSLISGSSLGVSGPAAGLAVIVLNAIQELDAFETFLLAVFIAGIIQILLGIAKAGIIGYYFPSAVIHGMLSGIGLIIILKQIPHAFGYDGDPEGDFKFFQVDGHNTLSEFSYMTEVISPGAIAISLISMFILILWERPFMKKISLFKIVQGPLIVVLAGILLNFAFQSSDKIPMSVSSDWDSKQMTNLITDLDMPEGLLGNSTSGGFDFDTLNRLVSNFSGSYVHGTVVNENGSIMGKSLVKVLNMDGQEINKLTTGENGNYLFEIDSNNTYQLVATSNGFVARDTIVLNKTWNSSNKLGLVSTPGSTVQGMVQSDQGVSVGGVKVWLYNPKGELVAETTSDANGWYQFALIENEEYQVVAKTLLALESDQVVSIPVSESVTDFIGQFTLPDFGQFGNWDVYILALTIAVVASLETLLCVEATDKLDPDKRITPTNRELIAQGVGNSLSGLIGGLPVTQVIVRSSANIQSGAKTKASAFFHGVIMLACAMLIPSVLNMIPLASLAAILFMVGYKLAKPSLFKLMYSKGLSQFLPFIITILGILFTDLLIGIGLGLGSAIMHILWNNYKSPYQFEKEDHAKDEPITIQLAQEVTFLHKARILRILSQLPDNSHVVIDASQTNNVHFDVLEIIDDFEENAKTRNIKLERINFDIGSKKNADSDDVVFSVNVEEGLDSD